MIRLLNRGVVFFLALSLVYACKHKKEQLHTSKHPAEHEKHTKHEGSAGEVALMQKLGLDKKEIAHHKLYSFVNEWYGVPYKYGGCTKEGVDCSCFVCEMYKKVYQNGNLNRTAGEMFKACEQISADDAKQGDLFFFKINGDKISHVGVCLKKDVFVHASTSKGVMINSIEEAYYKKYFFCAGRIKKT